jgi:UDP-glucose 6-dehydrogenase
MENSFLALKVAFCNEFFDLCQSLGIDYDLVRDAWLQDRRMGASHTLVTAERGYGGKCLPKDIAAVCDSARRLGVPMEVLEAAQRSNSKYRQSESIPGWRRGQHAALEATAT